VDGRGTGARGGGARVEGVDATYAQYVTQEYTGSFEPDTRVRVRINNLVAYLETVQAGARVSDTGAVLFRAHHASCHGADARGAGRAATALRTLPPGLTAFATRNGGVSKGAAATDHRGPRNLVTRRSRHAGVGRRHKAFVTTAAGKTPDSSSAYRLHATN
jgi:hypothetical protein